MAVWFGGNGRELVDASEKKTGGAGAQWTLSVKEPTDGDRGARSVRMGRQARTARLLPDGPRSHMPGPAVPAARVPMDHETLFR